MELIEVPAGLAGVAVTATTVGDVLGEEGLYHYRGRSAVELAATAGFEEAASLVLDASGEPAIIPAGLPDGVSELIDRLDLRAGLSVLAAELAGRPLVDQSPAERRESAVRIISAFPALIASIHHGERREPRADLGHIANYLWMVSGRDDPAVTQALETYAILTIDHGFNNSTFTARVVASTGTDLGACVLAAYGALTGPRHGAVQSQVLDMLAEIGRPERAADWMREALASRRRILGFGHSVYRVVDPRVAVLRELTERISPERHELCLAVEEAGAQVLAGRRIAANVDLYSPVLLDACAIPSSLFTATFAMARVVGWCAHVLEQAAEAKIIRPAAYYVGPPPDLA